MPELRSASIALVVLDLAGVRFALPIESVERITPAAELTPLPGSPALVGGVINVAGAILPVLDLRSRFGIAASPLDPRQQFALVATSRRRLVLLVDDAEGVAEYDVAAIDEARRDAQDLDHLLGVLRLPDGVLLIHDPERFLSAGENRELADALQRRSATHG